MDDLITFLRAQLDRREAKAKAFGETLERGYLVIETAGNHSPADVDAAQRFVEDNEPEFVLADVKAKRQIIADCERMFDESRRTADDWDNWAPWAKLAYHTLWSVLENLVLPYVDHPEFREGFRTPEEFRGEWKP